MSETRKLVAILVADVVGYSRLAGADEDRTLSRLRALRRMTAMARTPVLPEATPEGALSAQLRCPRPWSATSAMTAFCAEGTSRIDVKHPLRIAALDASIGRKARLHGSPREGPESGGKPAFHR
jgi:hypothetical protein